MSGCWGCSTSSCAGLQSATPRRVSGLHLAYTHSDSFCSRAHHCAAVPGPVLRRRTSTRSLVAPLSGIRSQRRCQIQCSKNDSKPSKSRRPKRGWPPWNSNWFADWELSLPRMAFNLAAFFLLLRIWPLHGRSSLGQAQPVTVSVPFSEFIQQTEQGQVSTVVMNKRNIKYQLRPDSPVFQDIPKTEESVTVAFETLRPTDYDMPYEILKGQGVSFAAVDGHSNRMMTVLVSYTLHHHACLAIRTGMVECTFYMYQVFCASCNACLRSMLYCQNAKQCKLSWVYTELQGILLHI